jgi:hypothetical protein
MIQFRPEQMPHFTAGVEDAFVWEQVHRLKRDFPRDLAKHGIDSTEVLEAVVRRGTADAEKHGFDNRGLVVFYLDCTAILGPAFDSKVPWAADVLRRMDLIPESKADLLDQHLLFHHGS